MFKVLVFGLLALLGVSAPVNAQVFTLSINGTVSGSQTTLVCNSGSAANCLTTYPGGSLTEPFLQAFDVPLFTTSLVQGDNPFSWGDPRANGLWSGTINNADGFLTGQNLSFIQEDSSCRFGAIGCQYVIASASTFNVIGGIPEPGTWATMLLGFFAVGMVMRKKSARSLTVMQ